MSRSQQKNRKSLTFSEGPTPFVQGDVDELSVPLI